MSAFYSEIRPAYINEASYLIDITIEGSGTIAGQTFTGTMRKPDGTSASGSPTVAIVDAATRLIRLTLPGQSVQAEYAWDVRRTDNSSNLVVAHGIVDVRKTGGQV